MTGHEFRKYRGAMTQVEFAELLGVQTSKISSWELEKDPIPRYIENLVLCLHETGKIETGETEKTFAYIVRHGNLIGHTLTSAENGQPVVYGKWLPEKKMFRGAGQAKISRAMRYDRKWEKQKDRLPYYDVNYNGEQEPV